MIEIPFTSPLYPLPADYYELGAAAQKEARVNAASQWLAFWGPRGQHKIQVGGWKRSELLTARGLSLAHCMDFFDRWYLWPDPEVDFDPGFYDLPPLSTPSFHYDAIKEMGKHKFFVCAMPRGASKSTLILKLAGLMLLTRPNTSLVYATSTGANAKAKGQQLRDQLFTNQRIADDWGLRPDFGGRIQPARGMAPVGNDFFYLNNKSNIRCVSVNSRLRGMRPRGFLIDDAEFDIAASSEYGPEKIREFMEQLLFRVGYFAIQRPETFMWWFGTFVSKKHFLWKAMQTGPDGKAVDARFDDWTRMFVPAGYPDPKTGKLISVWPEMWPSDSEERARIGNFDSQTLEEMAKTGSREFSTEMLGMPTEAGTQHFKLDNRVNGDHAFWFEGLDSVLSIDPPNSDARICWNHQGETHSRTIPQFLREVHLFMTCDYAYTSKASSDFKVATVMAHLPHPNILFVLDMWAGKQPLEVFVSEIFRLASKWKVPVVWPEVVKQGQILFDSLKATAKTKAVDALGLEHIPAFKPLRVGLIRKEDRIAAALTLRFDHSLIKLPMFAAGREPWRMLVGQIEAFDPQSDGGGLEHDDAIDTLAMSQGILAGRNQRLPTGGVRPKNEPMTLAERMNEIKAGRMTEPRTGIPHAAYLMASGGLPADFLESLINPRTGEGDPRASAVSDTAA